MSYNFFLCYDFDWIQPKYEWDVDFVLYIIFSQHVVGYLNNQANKCSIHFNLSFYEAS